MDDGGGYAYLETALRCPEREEGLRSDRDWEGEERIESITKKPRSRVKKKGGGCASRV